MWIPPFLRCSSMQWCNATREGRERNRSLLWLNLIIPFLTINRTPSYSFSLHFLFSDRSSILYFPPNQTSSKFQSFFFSFRFLILVFTIYLHCLCFYVCLQLSVYPYPKVKVRHDDDGELGLKAFVSLYLHPSSPGISNFFSFKYNFNLFSFHFAICLLLFKFHSYKTPYFHPFLILSAYFLHDNLLNYFLY